MDAALILEGGGLRGVYSAGVLRRLMDLGIWCSHVYGVSIGACNGSNYVSRQPERGRIVNTRYVRDRRYLSYVRLLRGGGLFGMDFIFHTLPFQLVPFDFDTFFRTPVHFEMVVTDCATGRPLYIDKTQAGPDLLTIMRASCSLPFLTPLVPWRGRMLADGGLSDSVPIEKSLADGHTRHVVILTQPAGYRKRRNRFAVLAKWRYPEFPALYRMLADRHLHYNQTQDLLDRLEAEGRIFVIRPDGPLGVGRAERDQGKLYAVYDRGYEDVRRLEGDLVGYLGG